MAPKKLRRGAGASRTGGAARRIPSSTKSRPALTGVEAVKAARAKTIAAFQAAAGRHDYGEARALLSDAVKRDPEWTSGRITLARLLYEWFSRVDEPRAILEPMLETAPNEPQVLSMLSQIAAGTGDIDDAESYAERAIERFPDSPDPYYVLVSARPERGVQLAPKINEILSNRPISPHGRVAFLATLGRIAEFERDSARAFAAFKQANALLRRPHDPVAYTRYFEEMAHSFDRETIDRLARYGVSDRRPVFILGLPRSGSTLLERVLSRHAKVDTVGERNAMAVLVSELGARRKAPLPGEKGGSAYLTTVTKHEAKAIGARYSSLVRPALEDANAARHIDKMPGNFSLIGLIKAALPNAKIIHARRSPISTALSCFMQVFQTGHAFAQSLEHMAHYGVIHRRLMAHWREVLGDDLLEIDYEDLVEDPEKHARRGIEYLGLDWDPACLSPQESNRPVITASVAQVRRPIYRTSVARWRRYESQLKPLFDTWRAMGDDVYHDMMAASDRS